MITLEPGATLIMRYSTVHSSLVAPIEHKANNSGSAKGFLIISPSPNPNTITSVTLTNNQLTADTPRTLGLVSLYSWSQLATDDFSKVSTKDGYITGSFSNNTIKGFTGGVLGLHLNTFTIRKNIFEHNYGGNIGVSGQNIVIDGNQITYPGNGGNGDGITVFSYLKDATIINNTIYHGSCYGMWFLVNDVSDIVVENNIVSKGITGGIHFSESTFNSAAPPPKAHNILIQKNQLIGNKGFGISVDKNISGIAISENYFFDNHPNHEEDIGISKAAKVSLEKNVLINPLLTPQHPLQTNTSAKILYF